MPRPNPTIRIPADHPRRHILAGYPNAGPNPSISGMKRHFWGQDAYCIRCGSYVYKVPKEIYDFLIDNTH